MEQNGSLSLLAALKRYWPCVAVVAMTPTLTALAMEFIPRAWPLVFFGLTILPILLPYRLGKTPYSYVIVCLLVFFFVGAAIACVTLPMLGVDGQRNT